MPEEFADFAEALANPRALASSRSTSCVNPPPPGQLPTSPAPQNCSALNNLAQQPGSNEAGGAAAGVTSPKPAPVGGSEKRGKSESESQIVYRMDSDDSLDVDGKEARRNNRTASAGNAAALLVNPAGPHSSGTVRKISARFRHTGTSQQLQQQASTAAQPATSSSPASASVLSPPTLTSFISNLISTVQNQLGGAHHSSKGSSSSGSGPGSGSGNTSADPKQQSAAQQQLTYAPSSRSTRSPAASSVRRSSAMPTTSSSGTGGVGGVDNSLLGGMACGLLSTRMCSTPEIPRRSGATSAATSPNMNSSPIPRSPGSQRPLGSAALAVRTSLTPPFGGVGQLSRAQHAHLDISREHEQIAVTLSEGSASLLIMQL